MASLIPLLPHSYSHPQIPHGYVLLDSGWIKVFVRSQCSNGVLLMQVSMGRQWKVPAQLRTRTGRLKFCHEET